MTPTPEEIARIAATLYPHVGGRYLLSEADAAAVTHAGRLLLEAARQAPRIRGEILRAAPTVDKSDDVDDYDPCGCHWETGQWFPCQRHMDEHEAYYKGRALECTCPECDYRFPGSFREDR